MKSLALLLLVVGFASAQEDTTQTDYNVTASSTNETTEYTYQDDTTSNWNTTGDWNTEDTYSTNGDSDWLSYTASVN